MSTKRTSFRIWKPSGVAEDTPAILVKIGELGYWPTDRGEDLPEEVVEAAIAGSMFGWDCRGAQPAIEWAELDGGMEWTTFCKRTNDPKLEYIEGLLDKNGIKHRRNGGSFHAPILEVPEEQSTQAWEILNTKISVGGVEMELDDIDDNHPMFGGEQPDFSTYDAVAENGIWLEDKHHGKLSRYGTEPEESVWLCHVCCKIVDGDEECHGDNCGEDDDY